MSLSFRLATILYLFAFSLLAQPLHQKDGVQLKEELKKLTVTGTALYLAAHPDDENTGLIAYMANELKVRTAYLSLTRGDGGQNLIGSEQGEELGVIRTQELLEARKTDGGEQYFTRAYDFGYSKSAEESMDIWGKDSVLADVVWIIRNLQPDVIITRFPGFEAYGHGHHTASALLAQEAFFAAADPEQFPEQLEHVNAWQAKRLLYNASRWWNPDLEAYYEKTGKKHIKVDIGVFNAPLGCSYTEIAANSRTKHKSQGFGTTPTRGAYTEYLELTEGEPMEEGIMDGVDLSWDRVEGGKKVSNLLKRALRKFDTDKPHESLPLLVQAHKELGKLSQSNPIVAYKITQLEDLIAGCGGFWMEAFANNYYISPGGELNINTGFLNRSGVSVILEKIALPEVGFSESIGLEVGNVMHNQEFVFNVPLDKMYSQPYWLEHDRTGGLFDVSSYDKLGLAEGEPAFSAVFTCSIEGEPFEFSVPVLYRWNDPVDGESFRPVEVTPQVAVNFTEPSYIFGSDGEEQIEVRVKALMPMQVGEVSVQVPDGWDISPKSIPVNIGKAGEEWKISFSITAPEDEAHGYLEAIFRTSQGEILDKSLVSISYPHINTQTIFPKAETPIVRVKVEKGNERIGYIMGAGDKVPEMLKNIGYEVELISDAQLKSGDLSKYDVVIAGVRAFNTKSELSYLNSVLVDYVRDGGTFIVQYNVSRGLVTEEIGPYPFEITRDRVTVEDSPVRFLQPEHPVLNTPNKITMQEFEGWVQERGLYFVGERDVRYESVLAFQDPGEDFLDGGLLLAEHGRGKFIYTGLSFFRQLPAGVPGAYKLFVNLISY
ncbi:PIG-L family deacetylase [Cytophagaceae bacterium ABcell3]|nr:PIG-L family deacetylase [Cytophagaceae bacterium ABcell3]